MAAFLLLLTPCSDRGQSIPEWLRHMGLGHPPGGPEHRASSMAGCLPLSLLLLGNARPWHRIVAEVPPTRCAGRRHPSTRLHFYEHPSHGGQGQLPWLLRFGLVFETTGKAELCPILPAARSSLPLPQRRLQLNQPFPVTKSCSFFFSFSFLSQEVGGVGKELQGKPLGHALRCGAGPVPLLSGWRGAMGVGRGAVGQDGMVEVCCRLGLRWVGCKEEKAHTDLTGAPSPHANKRRSRQQSPALRTLPAAIGAAPTLPAAEGTDGWMASACTAVLGGHKASKRPCLPLSSPSTSP